MRAADNSKDTTISENAAGQMEKARSIIKGSTSTKGVQPPPTENKVLIEVSGESSPDKVEGTLNLLKRTGNGKLKQEEKLSEPSRKNQVAMGRAERRI